LLQRILVDVMLVLSDADAPRLDFDQLRQRVHQPSTNGHRSAHRDVVIWKLLARDIGCRIH
jgi:hypothetical protein